MISTMTIIAIMGLPVIAYLTARFAMERLHNKKRQRDWDIIQKYDNISHLKSYYDQFDKKPDKDILENDDDSDHQNAA